MQKQTLHNLNLKIEHLYTNALRASTILLPSMEPEQSTMKINSFSFSLTSSKGSKSPGSVAFFLRGHVTVRITYRDCCGISVRSGLVLLSYWL
jgi:predicted cation transporter